MTLHLVQIMLDARALRQWAESSRLGLSDLGYTVHGLLRATFGEQAPQPFHAEAQGRASIKVLGYGPAAAAALQATRAAVAEPLADACIAAVATKPMPTAWEAGATFDFQVRACPIRRRIENGRRLEIDAWLTGGSGDSRQRGEDGSGPARPHVYVGWLGEQIGARGADLLGAEVHRLDRGRLRRRVGDGAGGGRMSDTAEKPDVTFRGRLSVRDPVAFADLLARGLGRHKAFGFGMLLLRPPRPGFLGGT